MSDLKLKFSKNFLWGAATSAHQVEGNTHNQWTVWELESANDLAKQAKDRIGYYENWDRIKTDAQDPNNYVSGKCMRHYEEYEKDFELLRKMNMNSYRFSVEWSRLEPEKGVWSSKAFAHYREYLGTLKMMGIEPVVTLFHFTLPVWFSEIGGFEKRSNIKYFVRFVRKVVTELGSDIKYIVTINEPEVYVIQSYITGDWPPSIQNPFKAWLVTENLITAHIKAVKVIRNAGDWYKVSIAKHSCNFYAVDNSLPTRVGLVFARFVSDDYILMRIRRHCDFLGVNYYHSLLIEGFRLSMPEVIVNNYLNWPMSPSGIQPVIERLYKKYKLPILITENGLVDESDSRRRQWIEETLIAMQRAMRRGVKMIGYLHWSLLDNFEWAFGKWPRFGLAEVNYSTGERRLRPSARWFGRVIKKLRNL